MKVLASLFSSFVAAAAYGESEAPRVLRMGRAGTIDYTKIVRLEGCPSAGGFHYVMVGEKTDAMMRYNPPDPGNPSHTGVYGWGPEQINQYYEDAAVYFYERFGVDFRTVIKTEKVFLFFVALPPISAMYISPYLSLSP